MARNLPHRRWQDQDEGQDRYAATLECDLKGSEAVREKNRVSRMKRPAAAFDKAADVDVAGFLFNVVKEDINFKKKISAARQRWNVRSKVLSDELDEDEDLHNKLKCDQDTSDEQIATDNVKISTLETSISGESASVAQLTAEVCWYVVEGLAC